MFFSLCFDRTERNVYILCREFDLRIAPFLCCWLACQHNTKIVSMDQFPARETRGRQLALLYILMGLILWFVSSSPHHQQQL
mmetsp:Transcript_50015/g.121186  ORF Transcript_50015/g.121186 Transcript_50015/m.121186 type:complete len:82 (-) Transcript_50015:207-452(-)